MSVESKQAEPKCLLLVEDDLQNMDMLTKRLQRSGFAVSPATDGEMAISETERLQPDLVLMDVSLPKLDGYGATRILKSQQKTSHIPIIVLTAHAMATDEQKAWAAGCDGFATKPVVFSELLAKITRLLQTV